MARHHQMPINKQNGEISQQNKKYKIIRNGIILATYFTSFPVFGWQNMALARLGSVCSANSDYDLNHSSEKALDGIAHIDSESATLGVWIGAQQYHNPCCAARSTDGTFMLNDMIEYVIINFTKKKRKKANVAVGSLPAAAYSHWISRHMWARW